MLEKDKDEVRDLRLFRDMAPSSFDKLMQAAYAQEFPARLEMIRQGARANFLHVVTQGSVELYSEWKGRDATMGIIGPVTSFILAACIRDAAHLMSARTLEPSRIVMIPAEDIRSAFREDQAFSISVLDELATDYRRMVRHTKNLKLRNARERLAAYLLVQSNRHSGAAGFTLPYEKRLLAAYLAVTPESLSRSFKALADHGVHVAGSRVTITDFGRLRRLAEPSDLID